MTKLPVPFEEASKTKMIELPTGSVVRSSYIQLIKLIEATDDQKARLVIVCSDGGVVTDREALCFESNLEAISAKDRLLLSLMDIENVVRWD